LPNTAATYDRKQSGQMLLVPPYLVSTTDTYYISYSGIPGETLALDSRVQAVTDISFSQTNASEAVTGSPYRVFRVPVPGGALAWDISVSASAGNPDIQVRQATVPSETDNQAFSRAPGLVSDSVTLAACRT
jgi:hypothetical protein